MNFRDFRPRRALTLVDRYMIAQGELAGAERRERARNGYRLMKRALPPHLATNEARDAVIIKTHGRVLWDESLHPRWPAGTWGGQGGEFRPKNDGDPSARKTRSARADDDMIDATLDGEGGFILASTGGGRRGRRGGRKPDGTGKPIDTPEKPSPNPTPPPREPDSKPPAIPPDRDSKPLAQQSDKPPSSKSPRDVARWLFDKLDEVGFPDFLKDYLQHFVLRDALSILSYFEEPKTIEELRQGLTRKDGRWSCPAGYEVHHIAEQGISEDEKKNEKITNEMLQDRSNVVCAARFRHRDISDWYSTKNSDYVDENGNWLSPREYLRGKGWEFRYDFGIKQLKKFGVLQP